MKTNPLIQVRLLGICVVLGLSFQPRAESIVGGIGDSVSGRIPRPVRNAAGPRRTWARRPTSSRTIRLFEKSRLSRRTVGIAKVAQPDANQAKALLRGQADTVSKR